MKSKSLFLILFLFLFQGCFVYGKKDMLSLSSKLKKKISNDFIVTSIDVSNNLVIIRGSNFSKVNQVAIQTSTTRSVLNIQSVSESQILASATSALSLLINQSMSLVIASAEAQATFPITFTIPNETITTSHLSKTGASSGDILKYNGTNWVFSHLSSSQTYLGTWNANLTGSGLEPSPLGGDYYIISSAGNYNDGSSVINFSVGDWIMYSEVSGKWEKVVSGVSSKVNKTGDTLTGDLILDTLLKIKGASNYVTLKASSSLTSDVALTLPTGVGVSGQVLTTDGTGILSWTTISSSASGAAGGDLSGTYPNPTISGLDATKIGSGLVNNTKFSYLANVTSDIQAQLDANTANSATSANTMNAIVKRDASGNFSAGTITATLNGNANNVTGTVAITNGGTGATSAATARTALGLGTASTYDYVGCLASEASVFYTGTGWTCVSKADATKLPLTGGTLSGSLAMGANKITGLADPTNAQDAVTKNYVDVNSGAWSVSGGNIYRGSGNVGIGTSSPVGLLDVNGAIYLNGLNGVRYPLSDSTAGGTIALGADALKYLDSLVSTAFGNIAIGYQVMSSASAGTSLKQNTAIGYQAMMNAASRGTSTAIGYQSLGNSSTGSGETAIGAGSLYKASGDGNTAIGRSAGYNISSGYRNTIIGYNVGSTTLTTGVENILIGNSSNVDTPSSSINNFLNIGNAIFATGMTGTVASPAGNVGIGKVSPTYKLDINGDVGIASGSALFFGATSICTISGCVASSDRNLKEKIEPLSNSLEKVLRLQGVEYDWKDKYHYGDKRQVGFIAQDLEKIFPEVVTTNLSTGLKSVSYNNLLAPVVEAIKQFYKKFISLTENVNASNKKMEEIEHKIMELQLRINQLELENAKLSNEVKRTRKK